MKKTTQALFLLGCTFCFICAQAYAVGPFDTEETPTSSTDDDAKVPTGLVL
jgi:hypothetical protein